MSEIALDLTQYHTRRRHGDITVFTTWMGNENKPVMVLVPALFEIMQYVSPNVIPLENAWAWTEEMGDPRHCARACFTFAPSLNLDPYNPISLMRIASAVREELSELLRMPLKQTERMVVADAIRTDHDTGKVTHREITDNVR